MSSRHTRPPSGGLCDTRCQSEYYSPPPQDRDADLRRRLRELAEERRRFGVQRLHILLRREGLVVNHKRTERLYREESLSLRLRPRKSVLVSCGRANQCLSALTSNGAWILSAIVWSQGDVSVSRPSLTSGTEKLQPWKWIYRFPANG